MLTQLMIYKVRKRGGSSTEISRKFLDEIDQDGVGQRPRNQAPIK